MKTLKFKVGDRVKCVGTGEVGIITEVNTNTMEYVPYKVTFASGKYLWLGDERLELTTPSFKKGDKVIYIGSILNNLDGIIGKVTDGCTETYRYGEMIYVDFGTKHCHCYFSNLQHVQVVYKAVHVTEEGGFMSVYTGIFRNSHTSLTYQIGQKTVDPVGNGIYIWETEYKAKAHAQGHKGLSVWHPTAVLKGYTTATPRVLDDMKTVTDFTPTEVVYQESIPELVKPTLRFKVGDKVRVIEGIQTDLGRTDPFYTIIDKGAEISYDYSAKCPESNATWGLQDAWLELVPPEPVFVPKFKVGDKVRLTPKDLDIRIYPKDQVMTVKKVPASITGYYEIGSCNWYAYEGQIELAPPERPVLKFKLGDHVVHTGDFSKYGVGGVEIAETETDVMPYRVLFTEGTKPSLWCNEADLRLALPVDFITAEPQQPKLDWVDVTEQCEFKEYKNSGKFMIDVYHNGKNIAIFGAGGYSLMIDYEDEKEYRIVEDSLKTSCGHWFNIEHFEEVKCC